MSFSDHIVSIVIPTFKRPEALRRALGSVEWERVAGHEIEIVIADNDPAASAKDAIAALTVIFETPLVYVHVPEPGVSNARNGALAVAKGRYILFLDDDMEACAPWAQSLMDAASRYDAALVFGPVNAVMPEANNPFYDYMKPLFSRKGRAEDGLIKRGIGSGNCLIDRNRLTLPSPAFDPNLNQTGGEDDDLFRKLERQDINIAWTNQAVTLEHVPANRATLTYVWRRNFAFGQAPTKESADLGWQGFPNVVKWMAVGLAQVGIYGGLWLWSKIRRQPEAVRYWGRLAQAFGKIFWADKLSPKFYGV